MSYLHCHKCGWSQDDFWDENYNPIRFLLNWENELLNEKFYQDFPNEERTYQEIIAQELERHANTIRNMKWRTHEEFKRDYDIGIARCPSCGSLDKFDID